MNDLALAIINFEPKKKIEPTEAMKNALNETLSWLDVFQKSAEQKNQYSAIEGIIRLRGQIKAALILAGSDDTF